MAARDVSCSKYTENKDGVTTMKTAMVKPMTTLMMTAPEDEFEDHDSKETRLTLMEEVLLLGLKDRVGVVIDNIVDNMIISIISLSEKNRRRKTNVNDFLLKYPLCISHTIKYKQCSESHNNIRLDQLEHASARCKDPGDT